MRTVSVLGADSVTVKKAFTLRLSPSATLLSPMDRLGNPGASARSRVMLPVLPSKPSTAIQ